MVRQSGTDVTSLCMQFEKIGHGLLRKLFRGEGECVFGRKRGGNKKVTSRRYRFADDFPQKTIAYYFSISVDATMVEEVSFWHVLTPLQGSISLNNCKDIHTPLAVKGLP